MFYIEIKPEFLQLITSATQGRNPVENLKPSKKIPVLEVTHSLNDVEKAIPQKIQAVPELNLVLDIDEEKL